MAEYLIQGQTLADIADAIREKTAAAGALLPGAMPAHIRAIQTGTASEYPDVPDDIVTEAERVASAVNARKTSNCLTFLAMTDMHEMGDSDHSSTSIIEQYRRANLNAGQAARIVAEKVKPNFFANLGDLTWSSASTTLHDWGQSIVNARGYTAGIEPLTECFFTPGNHDVGYNTGNRDENLVTGMIGSYRYLDFTAKKIRVICLNTADVTDGTDGTERISGEQLQWFAQALDLSGKSDSAKWGIIILSHHPLDWGNIKPAANLLAAYVNGGNFSASHDGLTVSYNFAGKNAAAVIANFHGHVHCLKVGEISGTSVKRIAIPNACYGRNNEYGQAGNTEFGETTTYEKSDNGTGKNTAFCAVTIDLTEKIIYADCFGAGYDRIVSYGTAAVETFTVTNVLANANTSNGAATVLAGSAYSAVITANEGYKLDAVTITMGGTDITTTAYSGGVVTITEVTGNIVITVTTVSNVTYDVTNLVPTSQEKGSTAVYNGTGYKDGYRVSESNDAFESTGTGFVVTGWIPYTWSPENVLYIRGASVTSADYNRVYGFNEAKSAIVDGAYANGIRLSQFFSIERPEGDSVDYYKLTPLGSFGAAKFIRISLAGTGENLIITVNEPIVADGSSGDDSGNTGGNTGGDTGGTGVYTNLVSTSVATDGVTVFNTTGYMNGKYASVPHCYDDPDNVVTGFIHFNSDLKSIYIKGAKWDSSDSHCRMHIYHRNSLGTQNLAYGIHADGSGTVQLTNWFTVESLGENYYKWTIKSTAKQYLTDHFYCMSLKGTGANLIITHDEPVE